VNLSRILRQLAAAALAASATTLVLGVGGAAADASSCDGVTGFLDDHGRTVTAVFHVPSPCDKVSVLSWFAVGPDGEYPQELLEWFGRENVPPGDYQWTIAAPPRRCFRQLDLRVPGRNVDSIVGGRELCSSTAPSTTAAPSTTSTTTSTTTTTAPPAVLPLVATPPTSSSAPTTAPLSVLGEEITRPAQLPSTGGRIGAEVTVALLGIGLGAGTLAARRWHQNRCGDPARS
jgi:hypothetical protein